MKKVAHLPAPATRRAIDACAVKILSEILDRLDSDDRRALPYFRIKELDPPFTRSFVVGLIKEGRLKARKFGRITLIPESSLRELEKTFTEWTPEEPRPKRKKGPR